MASSDLHATLAAALEGARAADGGFGLGPGEPSAPEPTALGAIALDDARARDWLRGRQHPDGGFASFQGPVEDCSPAVLAALALGGGRASARALDYALARRAPSIGESGYGDPRTRLGWGWTPETFAWVEPTARVLLAARVLRPAARAVRREARGLLEARQCPDGGWNYGNAAKVGVDPRGYLQTTAVALHALGRGDPLSARGLTFVRERWRDEQGGLSLAQALVALRLHGEREPSGAIVTALGEAYARTGFLRNTIALAWATLATAPDARLRALGGAP